MSKNLSEKYLDFEDDIEVLNNSIEKVHLQLDVIKKKIDKLTNTDTAKNKRKVK